MRRRRAAIISLLLLALLPLAACGGGGDEEPATVEDEASTWQGPLHLESVGSDCTLSYDGNVDVEVGPDGDADGTISADGSQSCASGGVTAYDDRELLVSGQLKVNEFELTLGGGNFFELAFICSDSGRMRLAVDSPGHAAIDLEYDNPRGDHVTCTIELDEV